MLRGLLWILSVSVAMGLASRAEASTITFNGTTSSSTFVSAPYSEDGYTLTPSGNAMYFMDAAAETPSFPGLATFDGDVLEFNFESGNAFTLTSSTGLFDLISVRTGSLGRNDFDNGDIVFTGFLSGGGSVFASMTGNLIPQTFFFSGFTSLTSVVVSSRDGYFPVIDDLTVAQTAEAVPDAASSFTLLAFGLAGVRAMRRRR